jgi:teichuronic acid biosynthesis glycosyltransferase TuaG
MVSIITSLYNNEKFIACAIQSVLNQSFTDWEMIIVDDASDDNGAIIVDRFLQSDHRINLIQLEKNAGAAVARNEGLERAKGKYIAFLDADDLWEPQKLRLQLEFMGKNGYAFTYTNYGIIDKSDHVLKKRFNMPLRLSYTDLLKNTAIGCSTVMIDRSKVGDFRMPLKRAGQDTATWLRLLSKGITAHGIDETLVWYRKSVGSISNNKVKALKRTWETYRKFEHIRLDKAIYYFSFYIFNAIKRSL